MAKRTMNKAFPLLLCLGFAGCHPRAAETPPLAGAAIGGPFTLTDQDGHAFSSTRLAGRYPIIYFGYTFCPDVCPTDMAVLGKGMRELERSDPAVAAKVQPIFVSVDPERDTPAVLKQFVAAFYSRLIGLTGTPARIAAVAGEYAIFYRRQPPQKGASGYLINHSREALLFGPDGKPIALVPVDADADAVAAMLRKWVR